METNVAPLVAVAPHERLRRTRESARVIVLAEGHVLLGERFDPTVPSPSWWDTPGGGLDPGETPRAAAVRELGEELGIDVAPGDLLGPVATQLATHGHGDRITDAREWFFVLRLPARIEPRPRLLTDRERLTSRGLRWFQLAGWPEPGAWFWAEVPALVALAGEPSRWPVDLGWRELSSVPAGPPSGSAESGNG